MGNNRTGLETMIGWVTDPGVVIVSASTGSLWRSVPRRGRGLLPDLATF
jgi:hypothetical protein